MVLCVYTFLIPRSLGLFSARMVAGYVPLYALCVTPHITLELPTPHHMISITHVSCSVYDVLLGNVVIVAHDLYIVFCGPCACIWWAIFSSFIILRVAHWSWFCVLLSGFPDTGFGPEVWKPTFYSLPLHTCVVLHVRSFYHWTIVHFV